VKIVILGAGLAGTIASTALRGYNPTVYEQKPDSDALSGHGAVMRIRSPEIGNLLGCNLTPIKATKEIFHNGKLHTVSNIQLNNQYSLKAYGCIGRRSLNDLGTVDRYLIDGGVKPLNCKYGNPMNAVDKGVLWLKSGAGVEYDWVVSTIPMPVMYSIVYGEWPIGVNFVTEDIYTYTINLDDIKSDVHQTIYFPDPSLPVYRVTLQGNKLLVEAVGPVEEALLSRIMEAFGIYDAQIKDFSADLKIQKAGKLVPIDEDERKAAMYKLTNEYNILSFGRYAVWKSIRTDNLLNDISIIKQIINSKTEYEKRRKQL